MKEMLITLSETLYGKISRKAHDNECSISDIMTEAVEDYFSVNIKREKVIRKKEVVYKGDKKAELIPNDELTDEEQAAIKQKAEERLFSLKKVEEE
jgi:hypothetical protein